LLRSSFKKIPEYLFLVFYPVPVILAGIVIEKIVQNRSSREWAGPGTPITRKAKGHGYINEGDGAVSF
jgi:hypothetical protein